jgi:hypothetical protein
MCSKSTALQVSSAVRVSLVQMVTRLKSRRNCFVSCSRHVVLYCTEYHCNDSCKYIFLRSVVLVSIISGPDVKWRLCRSHLTSSYARHDGITDCRELKHMIVGEPPTAYVHTKFNRNPSSGSRVETCGHGQPCVCSFSEQDVPWEADRLPSHSVTCRARSGPAIGPDL